MKWHHNELLYTLWSDIVEIEHNSSKKKKKVPCLLTEKKKKQNKNQNGDMRECGELEGWDLLQCESLFTDLEDL